MLIYTYPYPKKSADYETLDEMLLVKGMTQQRYDKLINYVTIYGDGAVNINTASKDVLIALGLQESLVDKILSVRRGRDGLDATADDHVFLKTFEIAADVNAVVPLQPAEMRAIDALNMKGLLGTNSYYFTIEVQGKLAGRPSPQSVCVRYIPPARIKLYIGKRGKIILFLMVKPLKSGYNKLNSRSYHVRC